MDIRKNEYRHKARVSGRNSRAGRGGRSFLRIAALPAVLLLAALVLSSCSGQGDSGSGGSEEPGAAEETNKTAAGESGAAGGSTAGNRSGGGAESADTGGGSASAGEPAEETEIKLPDFKFTEENFPRLDGSTSTRPLALALTSALLDISPEEADREGYCDFSRTTESFRSLMRGEADMLIVSEPQGKVLDELAEAGFNIDMRPVANEGLVFMVNEKNPVDSLTADEIRGIYSGAITNWSEVGGEDAEIVAFQRNQGSGSQALMDRLVMGGTAMAEPEKTYTADEMGELIEALRAYDNSANALGYTVYYYANDMKMADGLKIIAVDGVEPSDETISGGEYPFISAYYSVLPDEGGGLANADSNADAAGLTGSGEENDPDGAVSGPSEAETGQAEGRRKAAEALHEWLMSEDGQRFVAREGYVSVNHDIAVNAGGAPVSAQRRTRPEYERLDGAAEGELTELSERDDYGMLVPYYGNEVYADYETEDLSYSYLTGYMMGFFDTGGRLVTDPVYNLIEPVQFYDSRSDKVVSLPFYRLTKYDEGMDISGDHPEDAPEYTHVRFASLDGSYISDEYGYAEPLGNGGYLICGDDRFEGDFVVYDENLNTVISRETIVNANAEYLNSIGGATGEGSDAGGAIYLADCGEGYFVAQLGDGKWYFIDEKTGGIRLGPYDYAEPFVNGFAAVTEATGEAAIYRIIDKNGGDVFDKKAVYFSFEEDGRMFLSFENDYGSCDTYIYDISSGEPVQLMIFDDLNLYQIIKADWGYAVTQMYDEEDAGDGGPRQETTFYDKDFNIMFKDRYAVFDYDEKLPVIRTGAPENFDQAAEEIGLSDAAIIDIGDYIPDVSGGKGGGENEDAGRESAGNAESGASEGMIAAMNIATAQKACIKGADFMSPLYTMEEVTALPYYVITSQRGDDYGSGYISIFLGADLEVKGCFEGGAGVIKDKLNGEYYVWHEDEGHGYVLADRDLNPVGGGSGALGFSGIPEVYGGIAVEISDQICRGVDLRSGEEIFAYQMIGSLGN